MIWYFFTLKAYLNIGCYGSSYGCNYCDVFEEQGLDLAQCNHYGSFCKTWYTRSSCPINSYNFFSLENMTIELCLQVCTINGFIYAGLEL